MSVVVEAQLVEADPATADRVIEIGSDMLATLKDNYEDGPVRYFLWTFATQSAANLLAVALREADIPGLEVSVKV